MAKSILVITDVHDTENCSIKKARDIAAPLGDKIDVVRFIKHDNAESQSKVDLEKTSAELADYLTSVFSDYRNKDAIQSQVVVTKDIAQWVVQYCQGKDFDLIVKAGHRSETLFHTPCDWELIRQLNIPVLIASQQHWRQKHSVLAAIDPTATDEKHQALNSSILQWTKKWAKTFDCNIHLVYTLPVANFLREFDIVDVKEYANRHRAEGEQKLSTLIQDYDLPNAQMHVTAGVPERAIPHCANKLKAELVIMGSKGNAGLKGMLFGNVAEKVMHNLRTDSLVIHL